MSAKSFEQLACHQLTHNDTASAALEEAFGLSQSVFAELQDSQRPSNDLSQWKTLLQLPGAAVFYATRTNASQVLGFFFLIPRTAPEIGVELPHIWIAAVHPASRGLGIFPLLMHHAVKHARGIAPQLTVCTYPERFTQMYRILKQHGWEEVARREEGKKVLMSLNIKEL